jgi:electron transport complex protein RnfE
MGIGFTLALFLMASIREIFGAGTFLGFAIPWLSENPILIFGMAPGGFFVFGCLIALVNKISKKKNNKEFGCHNCPSAYLCGKKDENPCATVGEGDDK